MKIPVLLLSLALIPTTLAACDPKGSDEDNLIGGWTRTSAATGAVVDTFSFGADGKMTFDENKPEDRTLEDHMTGSYTVTDGVMTVVATNTRNGSSTRLSFDYHVSSSAFSPEAMHAPAGHDGIVGAWRRTMTSEDLADPTQPRDTIAIGFDFRADGSFQATLTEDNAASPSFTLGGTWTSESPNTFRAHPTPLTDAQTSDVVFKLLDDQALVPSEYVWQRD